MSKHTMARCPDYQFFSFDVEGKIKLDTIGERMKKKMAAIPLPDLKGKSVLDVGCDFGFWSFLASNLGASRVMGLDRCRPVNGQVFDLVSSNNEVAASYQSLNNCRFWKTNIGKQWHMFGKYDYVFLFSLYHHIFENCGDHEQIFYWLWQHVKLNGYLLWENPVDVTDPVAHSNISKDKHSRYNVHYIMAAAEKFFDVEYVGGAGHEPDRHVYRMFPKAVPMYKPRYDGIAADGAGGATVAFLHENSRRIKEINDIIGVECYPGSLNIKIDSPFDFNFGYFSGEIHDVANRSKGMNSEWVKREVRFYPIRVDGNEAYAMRFVGDEYENRFIEAISPYKLRGKIGTGKLIVERK